MRKHPALWKYGVFPVILNVLITGVVLLLLVVGVAYAWNRLHPEFPDGWGWLLLEIATGIALLLLALVAAFLCWLLMQAVLCGHFYSKLAGRVGATRGRGFLRSFWSVIGISTTALSVQPEGSTWMSPNLG